MLLNHYTDMMAEAGCDEAGRGCLAGPVFAAAVILPGNYRNEFLNDSKKLSAKQRAHCRVIIENEALAWAVASVEPALIDEINILNASMLCMRLAIEKLKTVPEFLIIDGNRFTPYPGIPHQCIVKGDGKYLSIAAASILAKTWRDEFMEGLHKEFPLFGWDQNKGYPTKKHRNAIGEHGITRYHRKSFRLFEQIRLEI